MIMGADPQLPMTGGSEYITESQLPSHSHPYYGPYFAQTNRLTGGPTFMTYMGSQLNASLTNGSPDQATEVIGSGQAYYPNYIQTYMWTKVLYYDSIIYSASGDAMGTFADVLGSLYPVGAQIYRTSAITQHPSDATKVQPFPTEAPLQQWQLVDNGSNSVVLENLLQSGETTSFCGRATLTPATGIQALSNSGYTVITGSEITNFTPVLGTKKIKYSFQFHQAHKDVSGLGNFNFEFKIDSNNWVEVTNANVSAFATDHFNDIVEISWVITLDDIDDSSDGRTTAVRPVLGLRVTGREWSSAHEVFVHKSRYYINPSGTATEIFRPPLLEVNCIGPETQAITYERTA
jgi:hypothetical protein